MLKKIVSVFLAFTLLFSISVLFASAEGETDVVKEEIKTNYPKLDLTALPGNKPMVIGAVEDVTDETCLYLYIYNPLKENIYGGSIFDLSVECQDSEGKTISLKIGVIAFSVVDKSFDSEFYKVRINLYGKSSVMSEYDAIHTYSWNEVYIKTAAVNGYKNIQKCMYKFDYTGDKTTISYEQSEVVTLDVHHTWYRSKGKVEKTSIFDEIHTVYFSIPDEYTKYYSNLYSVASTYTKKHTTPIIIGTNSQIIRRNPNRPDLCIKDVPFLSKDFEHGYLYDDLLLGEKSVLKSEFCANISSGKEVIYNVDYWIDDLYYYFHCTDEIEEDEDLKITSEELLAYVEKCESQGLNLKLFDSSEYVPWSEKTINEKFESISYSTQIEGNLGALQDEYGIWIGTLFWLNRGSPTKLQEIAERYAVDVPDKDIPPTSYLQLCDDNVIKEASNLSLQAFSDKYLINVDDVPEFKDFLNKNKNVVLYRYDVVDYYSEEIVLVSQDGTGVPEVVEDGHRYCAVQEYAYYGFRVIDVTFQEGDTFVSLCVNSHPQNFASDPGLETDDPPIVWNPDIKLIKDDGMRLLITVVVVLVGIVVVISGVKYFINAIASSGSNKKNE